MDADALTMVAAFMSGVAVAVVITWLGRIGRSVVVGPAMKAQEPGRSKPAAASAPVEHTAPSPSAVVLGMLAQSLPAAYEVKGPMPKKIERALKEIDTRVEAHRVSSTAEFPSSARG